MSLAFTLATMSIQDLYFKLTRNGERLNYLDLDKRIKERTITPQASKVARMLRKERAAIMAEIVNRSINAQ